MSRIIAWGSYDESKPRVRLLLGELRVRGALHAEINLPVWNAIRDKAVASPAKIFAALIRLLASYPVALARLIRQPGRLALLLPYPAIPDIFFAWPIARLRGHTIIFDAFISMHDTIVSDRGLVEPAGLASKLIWNIERLALRLADIILVDTDQHGDFFASEFRIARDRFQTVLVGAEPAFWAARDGLGSTMSFPDIPADRPIVLFYGQLIPLHGLDTILDAIDRTTGEPFHWLLVGTGQDEPKLRRFLAERQGRNVSWIPWVDFDRLPMLVSAASVALGIFGTSDKAGRVIPNKAFQILAAAKPLITRSSPTMDMIAQRYSKAIFTVPAGDGEALANSVRELMKGADEFQAVSKTAAAELGPASGVQALIVRLRGK